MQEQPQSSSIVRCLDIVKKASAVIILSKSRLPSVTASGCHVQASTAHPCVIEINCDRIISLDNFYRLELFYHNPILIVTLD